ncbi:MAG: hypothetical protein V1676_05320 [Candidatus Diapherotrites archaeon]
MRLKKSKKCNIIPFSEFTERRESSARAAWFTKCLGHNETNKQRVYGRFQSLGDNLGKSTAAALNDLGKKYSILANSNLPKAKLFEALGRELSSYSGDAKLAFYESRLSKGSNIAEIVEIETWAVFNSLESRYALYELTHAPHELQMGGLGIVGEVSKPSLGEAKGEALANLKKLGLLKKG